MSPSLPERRIGFAALRARIAPQRARLAVGPQGATLHPAAGEPISVAVSWPRRSAPPLEVIAGTLGPLFDRLPLGAVVSVAVADAWARTQILDLPAGLRGSAEREAFVQLAFRETYGAAADGWRIACEPSMPGQPLVACALDGSLVDALHGLLGERRQRLASLRPAWVAVAQVRRSQLAGARGALLTLADGCATLARWEAGAWRAQRVQAVGARAEEGWTTLLHTLLPPIVVGEAAVYGPRALPKDLVLPQGWRAQPLDLGVSA